MSPCIHEHSVWKKNYNTNHKYYIFWLFIAIHVVSFNNNYLIIMIYKNKCIINFIIKYISYDTFIATMIIFNICKKLHNQQNNFPTNINNRFIIYSNVIICISVQSEVNFCCQISCSHSGTVLRMIGSYVMILVHASWYKRCYKEK